MKLAVIAFTEGAVEPAETTFVSLIGWHMTVMPSPHIDIAPFTGELTSIGVNKEDGNLKGIWRPTDTIGNYIPDALEVMLDLYDELDQVEVL